jgi:hypothetical protein
MSNKRPPGRNPALGALFGGPRVRHTSRFPGAQLLLDCAVPAFRFGFTGFYSGLELLQLGGSNMCANVELQIMHRGLSERRTHSDPSEHPQRKDLKKPLAIRVRFVAQVWNSELKGSASPSDISVAYFDMRYPSRSYINGSLFGFVINGSLIEIVSHCSLNRFFIRETLLPKQMFG